MGIQEPTINKQINYDLKNSLGIMKMNDSQEKETMELEPEIRGIK